MSTLATQQVEQPPLSVVIATTQPWPEVKIALDSVHAEARALGAELLLLDGSTTGALPADEELYEGVAWVRVPGETVFQARARGIRMARGGVVAVTEDHCAVATDWCAAHLRAHAECPAAAAVGGSLENGAVGRLVDWASFLVTSSAFLTPLQPTGTGEICGPANVSYKGWAARHFPEDTLEEGRFRRDLAAAGHALISDDRIRVTHVQRLAGFAACTYHFHDGRTVLAARRHWSSPARIALEVLKGICLPARVLVACARVVTRTLRRRPDLAGPVLRSVPWMIAVMTFHAAGELVGLVAGRSESTRHMR